ncbi:MAG: heme-binding protein [Phycisphaerales bacterium]
MVGRDTDGVTWRQSVRARASMVLALCGVAMGAMVGVCRAQDAAAGAVPAGTAAQEGTSTDRPSSGAKAKLPADSEGLPAVQRVGGDKDAKIEKRGENYYAGVCSITTPLPVGYPDPTPPGAIDVKVYPSVRRAEVSGTTMPDYGMYQGFFPLFNHIKKREIAMTSPVEMDYRMLKADGTQTRDHERSGDAYKPTENEAGEKDAAWTMSFLYRNEGLGPTGADGRVEVRDAEPLVVVSIGMKGSYMTARVKIGVAKLNAWLESQDQWEAAGPVRALYYNGPDVARQDQWSEVQVPVKRKARVDGVSQAKDATLPTSQ